MHASFAGLAGGMVLAIVLVYLLMVMSFQSWLDPMIVLMAVPCALSGVIWALDRLFFAERRKLAAASAGTPAERVREPIAVEYARSFFPVIVLVLVIRSFLFEPFRIPSDSMMPTLFDGDFIFVSKYSYGLRLPVSNTLVVPTGTPQRGDVIVFRLPPNPKINYIKRLVGLPGDRIRVDANNQLYLNDVPQPQQPGPAYTGPKQDLWNYTGVPTATEVLGAKLHMLMFARGGVKEGEWVVPEGHYFFMGDNRNNSKDSRWLRPYESGLILILVTDLSGGESELRFNKGSIREDFYGPESIRTPGSTRRAPQLRRPAPPPLRHAPTAAWHDPDGVPLHSGARRAHRLCRSALDARVPELHQGRS